MHKIHGCRRLLQHGFTLVELLIVVIILAILAAIVVPQFSSTTTDAKLASLDSTLSNVRSSLDLYLQQHTAYPGAVTSTGTCGVGTNAAGAINTEAAMLAQLTNYTDANGLACSIASATVKFGPYMKKVLPPDPIMGVATVEISTTGDLAMTATGTAGGWKYDVKSGKFIMNHTTYQAR
ncbi:MAG: type II secretion system GspH family protein [Gammaproteobacteria bacterium]|nr:type II secretion system GspH family protein [Gammaproteobacteria bacterium]MDH3411083.1 type II secretion system GspH family protein [Gammaproteobacteria bacterium]